MPFFQAFGLGHPEIKFIKELIFGHLSEAPDGWTWSGRGDHKKFLFEIVANKRNGIDVDKFDYFLRDSHHLGLKCSFDAMRLMRFAVRAGLLLVLHQFSFAYIYFYLLLLVAR